MFKNANSIRRLGRVAARPHPEEWGETELLTLAEAAALLFPNGPLTERKLRTATGNGLLGVAKINGNIFTTKRAVADMCRVLSSMKSPATVPAAPEQTEVHSRETYVLAKLAEKNHRAARNAKKARLVTAAPTQPGTSNPL